MNFKMKRAYTAIVMLAVLLVGSLCSSFISIAEEAATTTPVNTEEADKSISYDKLSDKKINIELYNQNKAGMYFDMIEAGKNGKDSKFAFYFRIEQSVIKECYENYAEFKDTCALQALYREKAEGLADNEGWKAVESVEIIEADKTTDSANKKEYINLAVDLYGGGMKDIEAGKTYEIIFQFKEKHTGAERIVRCSSEKVEVTYTSEMYVSWRNYFATRAGVDVDNGKINESTFSIGTSLQYCMGYLMRLFYFITSNYLVSILLFAVVIKIVMFPTGIKQQKNMVKQAKFAPKQVAIQRQYKGRTDQVTMQKMQREIQEAQAAENISLTGGGCLPIIIQMFILIALYGVIRNPLTYMSGVSVDAVNLIKQYFVEFAGASPTALNEINVINLLAADFESVAEFLESNFSYVITNYVTLDKLPNFELFKGFNMADSPSFEKITILWIVPVLVFFSYYFSMKITRKLSYQAPRMEGTPDMAAGLKIMDITMPALSTFICFSVPSLLGIYWIFQSIIGVVQSYILKKMYPFPVYTEEDYKKAELEYKEKHKSKRAKEREEKYSEERKSKSLHYSDEDEEYAVLPERTSVHDLPKSEQEKIKENNQKKSSNNSNGKGGSSSGSSIIGKAEMDDKRS